MNTKMYIFFQAEDGIRDFHVTGVQTCALPICARASGRRRDAPRARPQPDPPRRAGGRAGGADGERDRGRAVRRGRSEERRVGEECRFQCVLDVLSIDTGVLALVTLQSIKLLLL